MKDPCLDPKTRNQCPIAVVAGLVGDMWTLLIIRDLAKGSARFGDLVNSLQGISTRTLTVKLKKLEENGLITRKTFRERPPRVEYSLTKKGTELTGIIDAMRKFGEHELGGSRRSK